MSLSSQRDLKTDIYRHYINNKITSLVSMESILSKVFLYLFLHCSWFPALSLESTISSVFGFSQLDSEFQVIVVRCLIEDIVVICSLFYTKFPSLLSRYLPHLFPSDLTTIKKLLDYAKRLHLGVVRLQAA